VSGRIPRPEQANEVTSLLKKAPMRAARVVRTLFCKAALDRLGLQSCIQSEHRGKRPGTHEGHLEQL